MFNIKRRILKPQSQLFVRFLAGKSYKSKVCFTKHLWEHSIYWETFDGVKNQERVLSIQAAIILSNPLLEFLLVTSPSPADKKKEDIKPCHLEEKQATKKKRKVLF